MRTIPIHVDAAKLGAIHLGKQGESLACRVRFYASKWHEDYPEAEYQLFVSPPGATPYLANITEDNGVVTWELAAEDTTIPGTGSVELILTDGETKIKSVTYRTTLDKSPSSQEPGSAPQVHPTWWENAITMINEATEEAVSSIDGALESEKAEAKAAIAEAAEEAIESIPEDYTALAGDVSSLKHHKLNKPTDNPNGEAGQTLRSNGDGTTSWAALGLPTDEQTDAAVKAWLDDHPEATTTVQDHSLTIYKMAIGELGYISPQMFGAKGDGVTDDSDAIKAAIAALPKENGVLFFPPGVYIHGDGVESAVQYPIKDGTTNTPDIRPTDDSVFIGKNIRFEFDGYKNLTIYGDSAIVRSNDKNGEIRNNGIFIFKNCKGLVIKDLTVDGRRVERGAYLLDYGVGDSNSRGNIYIRDSQDVTIENVISINAIMDNLTLLNVERATIVRSKFNNGHRQGISIVGAQSVNIDKCEFVKNGISGDGYAGTMPKSGIDLEAGADYPNKYINITDSLFADSGQAGLIVSSNTSNVTVEKCTFRNDFLQTYNHDADRSFVKDCYFYNSGLNPNVSVVDGCSFECEVTDENGYNPMFFIDGTTKSGSNKTVIRNCVMNVSDETSETPANICVGIRITGIIDFIGNIVKNAFTNRANFYPIWLTGTGRYTDNVIACDNPASGINAQINQGNGFFDNNIVSGYSFAQYKNKQYVDGSFRTGSAAVLSGHTYKIPCGYAETVVTIRTLGRIEKVEYSWRAAAAAKRTLIKTSRSCTNPPVEAYMNGQDLYLVMSNEGRVVIEKYLETYSDKISDHLITVERVTGVDVSGFTHVPITE